MPRKSDNRTLNACACASSYLRAPVSCFHRHDPNWQQQRGNTCQPAALMMNGALLLASKTSEERLRPLFTCESKDCPNESAYSGGPDAAHPRS
eukprot:865363-Alexandrium_andersonii.AAC.1